MIREHEFELKGRDGAAIAAYRWSSPGPARAVVQVAHGMGEHARRYLPALAPLIEAGVVVYANDHRGHGRTATTPAALGDFGAGGFESVVDDMVCLTLVAMEEQPRKSIVLLGHSMGSFAAQHYALDNSALIDGLVLSGSAALDLLAQAAAGGPTSLEAFNAPFEPARTPFDWLSRDPAEVDKYVADPLCGFTVEPASIRTMFGIAAGLSDPNRLRLIRPDLPIYLFAGDADPLNAGLALLTPVVDRYRAAGLVDITTRYYSGGRHEMLNETNRSEVVADLSAFIDRIVRS